MADAAGKMDERITLQRLNRSGDGGGGVVEDWDDFLTAPTVWASVAFKSGGEKLEEGRMNAAQTITFEIYNRNDVSEVDGILWRGEFYNIRAIRRYGPRRLRMWVDAERGVAN